MKITIISGKRGGGKTTFLKDHLQKNKFAEDKLFGFIAENKANGDEYSICNITNKKCKTLCKRNSPETGKLQLQDFWFNENTIKTGAQWLREGFKTNNPVFIIDEIGKFELDGFVWDNILKSILKNNKGELIITVRNKFLESVLNKYSIRENAEIIKI